MTDSPVIALAGASGDLGFRIARALIGRGAEVRALVRPDVSDKERARLEAIGLSLAEADPRERDAVASACAGATCVVSALNGLGDVILDRQTVLLDAAVQAGVPRFISSDYSLDFTKTQPGRNRNLDLRRAFMDMLGAEMPIIRPRLRRVLFWGRPDEPLDFTTKDNVAAYVAAVALDPNTPRILRIAGDTMTPRDIAAAMTDATGRRFRPLRVGGIGALDVIIRFAKPFAPADAVFPPWQGMQYMRDMMSGRGKLTPLDNDRYPDIAWTTVADLLVQRRQAHAH